MDPLGQLGHEHLVVLVVPGDLADLGNLSVPDHQVDLCNPSDLGDLVDPCNQEHLVDLDNHVLRDSPELHVDRMGLEDQDILDNQVDPEDLGNHRDLYILVHLGNLEAHVVLSRQDNLVDRGNRVVPSVQYNRKDRDNLVAHEVRADLVVQEGLGILGDQLDPPDLDIRVCKDHTVYDGAV